MGNKATNFGKKKQGDNKEEGKEKQGVGGGKPPTFADYGLDPALVSALSKYISPLTFNTAFSKKTC